MSINQDPLWLQIINFAPMCVWVRHPRRRQTHSHTHRETHLWSQPLIYHQTSPTQIHAGREGGMEGRGWGGTDGPNDLLLEPLLSFPHGDKQRFLLQQNWRGGASTWEPRRQLARQSKRTDAAVHTHLRAPVSSASGLKLDQAAVDSRTDSEINWL